MKRILIILLLFPFISTAQNRTDSTSTKNNTQKPTFSQYKTQKLYSYTLGIKVFSYEELPEILKQVNAEEFQKQFLNGIMLKINDNQISYRLSGNFYSDNLTFKNECKDCEEVKGKLSDVSLKLGFEKTFMYADIQPYFGFDLGFRRNIFKGTSNSLDVAYPSYDVKTQKNSLSLSPLFGIKFNIINHFTLAAESSLDLMYTYEKQEKNYAGSTSRTPSFNDYKKWEYLFKPVGMISIQYNFGEIY